MIVLDTNVVLEARRRSPNPNVLAWLDHQNERDLWLTAISAAELLGGVERSPRGTAREAVAMEVAAILNEDFPDRVLPFDLAAAAIYATIAGPVVRPERQARTMDFQIAAIARSRGADVATRNVHDFRDCGVTIINPWDV